MDTFEAIMIIEERDCTFEEYCEAVSTLTKAGVIWTLQGSYGRLAKQFIDNEFMDEDGNLDWNKIDNYKIEGEINGND